MSERNERFRESLRDLAASAAGEPPLSGPELRRLAERRRRRRLPAASALALSGLLVGGTAFAISGGFGPAPRPAPPVSAAEPSTPAAGSASAAPDASGSPEPRASTPSGRSGGAPVPTVTGRVTTAAPSVPPVLPDPGAAVACVTARAGESLVRLHALQLPGGLAPGVDALLYAVPVECVRGQLTSSGAGQWLTVLPGAVVTDTGPPGTGAGVVAPVETLAGLATGLAQHPEQLFGIRRDASGRVYRLDRITAKN